MRFVFDLRRDEHITPYFERLKCLKVDRRRVYVLGCFVHSLLVSGCPEYLYSKLVFRSAVSGRETRGDPCGLSLPFCRTEFYKRSFFSAAAEFWNGLLASVITFATSFREKLYVHLLNPRA